MNKLILVSFATLFLAACADGENDGISDADALLLCNQTAEAICKPYYTGCFTADELMTFGFPATEAACVENRKNALACSDESAETICDMGESFHRDMAEQCIDDLAALECQAIKDGEVEAEPDSCAAACQVDDNP